jgi:hypothetical protein
MNSTESTASASKSSTRKAAVPASASTTEAARILGKSAATLRLYAWLASLGEPPKSHGVAWKLVTNPGDPMPVPVKVKGANYWDVAAMKTWFARNGRRPVSTTTRRTGYVFPEGLCDTEELAELTGRMPGTLRHYASVWSRETPTDAMGYMWNSLHCDDPMPAPVHVGRVLAWKRAEMTAWFERRSQRRAGRPLASKGTTTAGETVSE